MLTTGRRTLPSLRCRQAVARVALTLLLAVPGTTQALQAAAGAVDVTPPPGTFLAGYGRDRRATGQFDELWAKAVLLRDGADAPLLALITLDNIGYTYPDVAALRERIRARLGAVNVVVSSTHTHAGPDVVGLWGPSLWRSGRNDAYVDSLIDAVVALLTRLQTELQPVTLRLGAAQQPLPWVENVSEPELLDRQLSVLQLVDAQGNSVATLTNHACHPTVLGPDNTLVSADYLSGFYTAMAEALPGEHLFLQGSIGGWVQPLQGDRSIELARDYGESLAAASLAVLQRATPDAAPQLVYRDRRVRVPLENWGFRLLMWLGVLNRELDEGAMVTEVAAFRIGTAVFVTHPGETSPAYSLASRQAMDTPFSFVLGLGQDAMGYILKPEYFAEGAVFPHGDYLTSVSVGPEAGPRVMAAVAALLSALDTP